MLNYLYIYICIWPILHALVSTYQNIFQQYSYRDHSSSSEKMSIVTIGMVNFMFYASKIEGS